MPRKTKKKPDKPAARATDVELEEETDETGEPAAASTVDPKKLPRAKRLPAQEFEEFLSQYPETDGTMFYLYRLEPKIDRSYTAGDDAETNIDKGSHQKFSIAWLRAQHGSGRYQVRFKDAGKQVCDSIIDVNEYTEFPPIVDVRELVDCDANRSFINNLIARGKAYRDAQGFLVPMDPNKSTIGKGETNQAEVVDRVLNFAEKMARQQPPAGASKLEEHAGLKAVDAMVSANQSMMAQLIGLMGKGEGKSDHGLTTALLTLLTTSQTQQQTLMLEFLKLSTQGTKGGSGIGSLGTVLDLLDRLADSPLVSKLFKGAAAGEDVPWWERLAEKVAPELVPLLRTAIVTRQQPAPAASAVPAAAPATPAPASPAKPEPATISTAPAAGIPANQSTEIPATRVNGHAAATPAQPAAAETLTPVATMPAQAIELEQTRIFGAKMIDLIDRGKTGSELALMLEGWYGLSAYVSVAARGKEGMKRELQKVPEIWRALEMLQPTTDEFIQEFLDYGNKQDANAPAE